MDTFCLGWQQNLFQFFCPHSSASVIFMHLFFYPDSFLIIVLLYPMVKPIPNTKDKPVRNVTSLFHLIF